MTHWQDKLLHPVVPVKGPLPSMRTLVDVAQCIAERLPSGRRSHPQWQQTSVLLEKAARSGDREDIKVLTRQLMRALDSEHWSI
jgi:hypothetical protein